MYLIRRNNYYRIYINSLVEKYSHLQNGHFNKKGLLSHRE